MAFSDAVNGFTVTVRTRSRAAYDGIVEESTRAIVEGSELTGSPGQPFDTGNLKGSWQTVRESPTRTIIGTNVEYARAAEDGVGPHGPVRYGKSGVGGSHSVKLLAANFDRVVEAVVARVKKP